MTVLTVFEADLTFGKKLEYVITSVTYLWIRTAVYDHL